MNSTTAQIPIQSSDAEQVPSIDEEPSTCNRESSQDYRLNDCQSGGWVVFDMADNIAFSGTLADCEAWMDRAENLKGETGFLSLIRDLLGFRRKTASPNQTVE